MRRLSFIIFAAAATLGFLTSGCYYGHLASGQWKLLVSQVPIEAVLEDPSTPDDTRHLLRLVGHVRDFAQHLGLRVGDQYTSYVEWPEDRIVTTLVRTRPPLLDAVPYWFPVVGHLPYKGYFDRDRAEAEAERLRDSNGFDVCVSGVTAYSTLGWLDDPVTTPMLNHGPTRLVQTVLHELVHATAFVEEDVDFNESVAQFIGQEAAVAFFDQLDRTDASIRSGVWPDAESVRRAIEDDRAIARTTSAFRDRLVAMAESNDAVASPPSFDPTVREKAETEARAEIAALPLQVIDPAEAARRARLSPACLALRGTYTRDLPRHARVLEALDGNLRAMIARLEEVAQGELDPDAFYRVDELVRVQ